MSPENIDLFEVIFRDAIFGLSGMAVLLLINTLLFLRIYFWFMKSCEKVDKPHPYALMSRFLWAVFLMSVVQLLAIVLWAAILHLNGLIEDARMAILFAGSCYTTLGVYADMLPLGWKSVAYFIAFSGLFSFAIATSAMMVMLGVIAKLFTKRINS